MKSLIEKISVDKIQKKRVKDRLDGGKKKKFHSISRMEVFKQQMFILKRN